MHIKKKKRFITLIEIMIVMFLIAMITGVVAYNYRGSLEEGRAFKTQQGIEKVKTILLLKVSDDSGAYESIPEKWQEYVRTSPLASNPSALIKDGWGSPYKVSTFENESGDKDIVVESDRYKTYLESNPSLFHESR
jgi:general secretion pathway protein G